MSALVAVLAVLVVVAGLVAVESSVATAADVPVLVVHRSYGDGPVRTHQATFVRILFEGRRGDRVRLDGADCGFSLHGPDGRPVPESGGFRRLTSTGTQVFVWHRCERHDDRRLQLEKLRVHHLRTNAPHGKRFGGQRGYLDAVGFVVPDAGALRLGGDFFLGAGWEGMVLPDGHWYPLRGEGVLYVEDGRRIHDGVEVLRGRGIGGTLLTAHAGTRFVLVAHGDQTVYQTMADTYETTVDAPALSLSPGSVPHQDHDVEFNALAGTWLHAEVLRPRDDLDTTPHLIGPDGRLLGVGPAFQVPLTGRYRLVVPPTAQVRIRTIQVLPDPMPLDGTPVSLTLGSPGEWVLANATFPPGTSYQLEAVSDTTSGRWFAEARSLEVVHCGGALGCGDGLYAAVDAAHRVSSPVYGYGTEPWRFVVMLRTEPGTTGSVDLALRPLPLASGVSRPAHR